MSGLVLGPHKLNSTWERAKRETVIQESRGAARGRPAAGAGGAAWSGGEKRAAQAAHVPVSLCRRRGSLTRPPHTHPCPFPVADGLSASCSRPSAPRWGPRGSRSASPASLLHSAIQGRSGVVRYPLLETSGAPALQPPISPRAFAGQQSPSQGCARLRLRLCHPEPRPRPLSPQPRLLWAEGPSVGAAGIGAQSAARGLRPASSTCPSTPFSPKRFGPRAPGRCAPRPSERRLLPPGLPRSVLG